MKAIKIILAIVFLGSNCDAQNLTLGEFYNSLNSIKVDTGKVVMHKAFSSFDFKSFLPVMGIKDSLNYFEIGYDSKGRIREITHYDAGLFPIKFIVYQFDKYKIMLMKYKMSNEFDYTPVAFLITNQLRLMFILQPLTGEDQYRFGYLLKYSPISSLKDISCVMLLNDALYPTEYYLIHKGYFRTKTQINYHEESYRIRDQRLQVLFSPEDRKGCKLEASFRLNDLASSRLFDAADMYLTVQPMLYKEGYPLWIYLGASWYK